VVTEEDPALWADRARRHNFGGHVCFPAAALPRHPRPTSGRPCSSASCIARAARRQPVGARPAGAAAVLREQPAQRVRTAAAPGCLDAPRHGRAGVAHPAKHHPVLGQAARGSGALLATSIFPSNCATRARPADAPPPLPGPVPATPRRACQLLLELNTESTDYLVVDEAERKKKKKKRRLQANWEVLRTVFEDAPQQLTREDILGEWPADFDKPSAATLRRWLIRAVAGGLVACEGSGRKADPFRYWFRPRRRAGNKTPSTSCSRPAGTNPRSLPVLTERKRMNRRDNFPSPGLGGRQVCRARVEEEGAAENKGFPQGGLPPAAGWLVHPQVDGRRTVLCWAALEWARRCSRPLRATDFDLATSVDQTEARRPTTESPLVLAG